jgi:hypothetical protein
MTTRARPGQRNAGNRYAMRYDLVLVSRLCSEIGLLARGGDQCVEVDLGDGTVLEFLNTEREEDCLVGFPKFGWHFHDSLMFADARGNSLECDYLNLLTGLADGSVLICEQIRHGRILDRWLIHRDYNDEFEGLDKGDYIVVRRAITRS